MSKYLVTGGAGFIGTNLVIELLKQNHEVVVYDNFSSGKFDNRIQVGATYVEGDIRDYKKLKDSMAGVQGVFHMAAIPRMPYSVEYPLETNDNNVNGAVTVLLAARDAGIQRVVYSASSSAYGNQSVMPFVETMKPCPMSPYGLQKYIGEEYARLFFELYGLETVSLRYFNVYGNFSDPNGAYALVIGKFLQQKKRGEPMTVCGDGEYYRDYTHVYDVARANILAMESKNVGHGEVINIGNKHPYSVNDLVRIIGGPSVSAPDRPGDPRRTEADITRAQTLLGWQPTVTLEEGIMALKKEWGVE